MSIQVVKGDLLRQPVDAIVNPWNRNTIPWWLLVPRGVSCAIKKQAGTGPFSEVAKAGRLNVGEAILTSAGKLPFKGIIHVAGINDLWQATEYSIRTSLRNAVALAEQTGFQSLAIPLIGAGSGSFDAHRAQALMLNELASIAPMIDVVVVVFEK